MSNISREHIESGILFDLRSVRITGFDKKIHFINSANVGCHAFASAERPILFTPWLCTCTALYVYSAI